MRTRVTALAAVVAFALVVATVAALAGRGGDDELVKLPIGSFGAGGEDAAASTAARSSMAYPGFGPVEYRLAGPLPDLPATAPAYRLASSTTATEVGRLAAALGVDGPAQEPGGAWVVRDGEHELRVEPVAGLPWYLGPACPDTAVSSDGAESGVSCVSDGSVNGAGSDSSTLVDPVCAPDAKCPGWAPYPLPTPSEKPPRPADLPSHADAERVAREAFTRLGVGLDGFAMEDGWLTWDARVEPRVEGLRVLGLGASLSIGAKGEIERANGFLARPERIGDYPLVGVEKGLERLRANVGIGPRPLVANDIAPVPPGAEPARPTDAPSAPPAPAEAPVPSDPPPVPPEPLPEPDPVVRTITGVHLALMQVDAVLVPVYVFELERGDEAFPVPAVTDEWLEQEVSAQPG